MSAEECERVTSTLEARCELMLAELEAQDPPVGESRRRYYEDRLRLFDVWLRNLEDWAKR